MVLTNQGKSLLSQGQLRFCYWTSFDDEIDYKPYVAESGSLSADQLVAALNQSIEDTPIREAVSGYRELGPSGSDTTNVNHPMFTMGQGQTVLPRSIFPADGTREIETKQRRVQRIYQGRDKTGKYVNSIDPQDLGIERFDSSAFVLDFGYTKDSFPPDFQPEGFHVRIFRSGSNGFTEVVPRRDMSNDLAYSNDVRVFTGQKEG